MYQVDELKLEVRIEYDEFITHWELSVLLQSIDRIVIEEVPGLESLIEQEYGPWWRRQYFAVVGESVHSLPTFVAIKNVSEGSIVIEVAIGMAAYNYVVKRYARGFSRGDFGKQIERLGLNMSDYFGAILSRVNSFIEGRAKIEAENGGNMKRITVTEKKKKRPSLGS